MKIAVLGARGLLGQDLVRAGLARGWPVAEFGHVELDIAQPAPPFQLLSGCEWVVNCAAYTNVDPAEQEPDRVNATNRDGTRRLAEWCATNGVGLLHTSTGSVFDGAKNVPYVETDPVNPSGVYACSKAVGEETVRASGARHIIARVQGLFGPHGRNFPSTILEKLDAGRPLTIVSDQIVSPTYTPWLAAAILDLLNGGRTGTVHMSCEGSCSWYEFACTMARMAGVAGIITPVKSSDYIRPAPRPLYSVLDKRRLAEWWGRRLPPWQDGVRVYLETKGRLKSS